MIPGFPDPCGERMDRLWP